jgi:hypothetical protein
MSKRISFKQLEIYLFISAAVTLAGCSTKWTKQGFNRHEWHKDSAICERDAAQIFPPQFITYQTPGYTTPVQSNCSRIGELVNCTTTGGDSYPITNVDDLNEENRRNAWERCIRARGYFTTNEAKNLKEPQLAESDREIVSAIKEYGQNFRAICTNTEVEIYFSKNPCKIGGSTQDKSYASRSEKSATKLVRKDRISRFNELVKQLNLIKSANSLYLAKIVSEISRRSNENYSGLIEGRITWGTHNKVGRELVDELESKIAAVILGQRTP